MSTESPSSSFIFNKRIKAKKIAVKIKIKLGQSVVIVGGLRNIGPK